jgi:hypothetical protein
MMLTGVAVDPEVSVMVSGRRCSREARLRPEFAALYPGLRAGEWSPAATTADRVLAGCLLRGGGLVVRRRVLPDAHFEFRGGESEGGEREGVRFGTGM